MHTPAVGTNPELEGFEKIHILQRLLRALVADIHILKYKSFAFLTDQGASEQKRAVGVDDNLLAYQAIWNHHLELKRSL